MVVHTFNQSQHSETEAGQFLSLKLAWSREFQERGLHRETMIRKKKKTHKN